MPHSAPRDNTPYSLCALPMLKDHPKPNMKHSPQQQQQQLTFTPADSTPKRKHFISPHSFAISTIVVILFFVLINIYALFRDHKFSAFTNTDSAVTDFRERDLAASQATIAYFLQLTNSSAHLVPRLLVALHHPSNIYVLHFDEKVPQHLIQSILRDTERRKPGVMKNTHILPSQIVSYAGISMVLNTLSVMTYLQSMDAHWDYFINLSGSDYPLVTQDKIRSLLGSVMHHEPTPNFFSIGILTTTQPFYDARTYFLSLDPVLTGQGNGTVQRTKVRNPAAGRHHFRPMYAEGWMILSRDFVAHAITSDLARSMLITMAYMTAADEHYFASLAYNHPVYNSSIIPCMFRRIVRKFNGTSSLQHPFNLDETDAQGRYILEDEIWKKGDFFARKFQQADSALLQRIDDHADDGEWVRKVSARFYARMKAGREGSLSS